MEQKQVLIIVLNYNSPNDTLYCLKSLRKYIPPALADIFLVENSPKPSAIGKEFADFYEVVPNRGYSHGNNIGLQKAIQEYYSYALLLNNDTFCTYNFLSGILTVMQDQGYAAASPKIIMASLKDDVPQAMPQLAYAGAFAPSKLGHWYPRGAFKDGRDINAFSQNETCDWLSGACLIVGTKYLGQVGLLDEDYFLYYEDVDWCLRAKKKGLKLGYVGSEYLYHQHSKSTSTIKSFYYPRAFLIFIKKHFPNHFIIALKRFFWHYFWPHFKGFKFKALWNDLQILKSVIIYCIFKHTKG